EIASCSFEYDGMELHKVITQAGNEQKPSQSAERVKRDGRYVDEWNITTTAPTSSKGFTQLFHGKMSVSENGDFEIAFRNGDKGTRSLDGKQTTASK
ncbi:MAG: hypothetical protein K2Z81_04510, partial [Cyanobacteria bacterium]|nr:hypothetical protein [Cyanobacteriota bacterium]